MFPISQVHVVHFETYRKSEIDAINKVFKFLDLEPVTQFDRAGQRIMSKEKVFGGKQYERVGPMMEKTEKILTEFYQPFNVELAKLLNDTRYLWAEEED